MSGGTVTGRIVAGALVAGAIVTGAIVGTPDGPVSEGTVELVFPASDDLPQDIFHLRRAMVGGSLSRAWTCVDRASATYCVSISHEGSRADPTVWESELAGASHAYATLGSGDQTATQVGTAVCTAFDSLGITECTNASGTVTIENVSNLQIGAAPTYNTALRGIWGAQRDVFGNASSSTQSGAMGGTGSVHMQAPACNGRALGAYMRAGGSNNVRLGLADGPAYSTTPAAFSNGVEGVATNNSGLRVLLFTDPDAFTSGENKWASFRGIAGGDPTLRYRNHSDSPPGNGDIPPDEQLLFSTTEDDPAAAIYTAGAYTHGAEAGPYSIYSQLGFIYECPSGGNYPGSGAIVTEIGSHKVAPDDDPQGAGVAQTVADDMDAETFAMRHVIPWDVELTAIRVGVADRSASEDLGLALYSFLDTVAPSATSNPLLRGVGPFGVAATGWQTHTLSTPLALTEGTTLSVTFNAGNLDGVTPTTAISVFYDANPGGDDYWATAWEDDGRRWNDMIPAGGGGLGVLTEYRTLAPDGDMPMGDPSPTWPDPFDVDATDDHSTENLLEHRIVVSRAGISGSEL